MSIIVLSREAGGASRADPTMHDFIGDRANFRKILKFEKIFQELCKDCGIHTFFESGKEAEGLRLCDLPQEIEKNMNRIIGDKKSLSQIKPEILSRLVQNAEQDIALRTEAVADIIKSHASISINGDGKQEASL